ncbi:response regulator [Roseivivax isoporae]|uniref:Response regulatory domain-containing protein n=1 Tax=Roseivivax isoporae LMG 25204 TaxID=1449351 RepID=X7F8K6_9RHOB|nr:response regulator [Roseivivax isoporae]ETX29033.1 hypothetical protein RISW2_03570 [Roseivivax isoporae LMG 25204]
MDMRGRSVLVVEDDYLQAHEIGDFFRRTGATVLGPALTIGAAMKHAAVAEAAILDLDMAGRMVYPVAETLARRNVPFVFYTGRGRTDDLPAALRHVQIISKPVMPDALGDAFARLHDPQVDPWQDVERMLPMLRVWSRLLLKDPASADRLVERALYEAIAAVKRGEVPSGDRATWLFGKCTRVLERDGPEIMN